MTKDFQRMGCTLDYSDSYMALKNEYMEGEWWLIKRAWEKKRLYLGEKVMTWCAPCETALAKHECEYEEVADESIFLKYPIKGKKNEFLVIWTTTPWTIPFNLGVMVNPELDYVKAKVDDEVWVLGKGLAAPFVQSVLNKKLNIVEEFKGEKLLGTEYIHPLHDKIPQFKKMKKKHPNLHTVVLSQEFVDFSAGTGLVHMAPGCGPEDYEVGREYNIPPFNNLNQKGEFPEEMGPFAGRIARRDDNKFIEDFEKAGTLVATTKVEHDYPHCWRCHQGVIFRTTKQWFFKIEDLKDAMIKANEKVHWVPRTQAFDSWTAHLRDNSITRQRFWGTPVPIWKCDNVDGGCKNIEVIGSAAELKKKAGKIPKDLHRPWIDKVRWKCSKCKGKMIRIPDIIDVWIDAGTAGWNCFYYPAQQRYFKEFFPADFILEATEQVRLWFSMLSICSQLAFGKNPYKAVYMHGMLNDIDGKKMSKSLGNIISPYELIDKHGADVLRYYMCQTNAGQDIRFNWDEAALKARYLQILWNVQKFLHNLAKENKVNPFSLNEKNFTKAFGIEEKYIISKLHSTISNVTKLFDDYRLDETIAPIEGLFLELSRGYIQMVRDKSSIGSKEEKQVCIYTIAQVILGCIKMFSIISPFVSEAIYLNLKDEFKLKEESITHFSFPKADKKKINSRLEREVEAAQQIIQAALHCREKAQLGLRWPIKEIVVITQNKDVKKAIQKLQLIIAKQVNTKEVIVKEHLPELKISIKPNFAKIGPAYGELSPQIIAKLATDNPEAIMMEINKGGAYKFNLECTGGKADKEIRIVRDMVIVEHDVPTRYEEGHFRSGYVYANIERTEELEAEGYSREVMRHVQTLRKKAGLEKWDKVALFVKVSDRMKAQLDKFCSEIAAKVGATKIGLSSEDSVEGYEHTADFKVKAEKFKVWLEKV